MKRFVASPNLPLNCSEIIYGGKYAGILKTALDSLHIGSILMPDNPHVDPRLAGHADLTVLHAGGEKLFLAPYLKGSAFAEDLKAQGAQLVFPRFQQNSSYPADVQFNVSLIGKYMIGNPKTAAAEFVDYLTNGAGRNVIPVRQGYSRCAVCIVDSESIITADRGIAAAASAGGLQVLLIHEGHVRLDGYAYGFIGGASFKLASDKLVFTGKLDLHPDRDGILTFLTERGIEPIYLTQEPIFDIGSAIPIIEN